MAGGMDLGGGKGKKSLDVAINLTPFIDLMAVTISFLIMTAVWTQIGRLQVAQLLLDGSTPGKGCTWMTVHDGAQVRLVAEGRRPGAPARSSSPWVWAVGGGGGGGGA